MRKDGYVGFRGSTTSTARIDQEAGKTCSWWYIFVTLCPKKVSRSRAIGRTAHHPPISSGATCLHHHHQERVGWWEEGGSGGGATGMQQRGLDGMGMPKQVYRLQGLRDMSTYPERKVQRQRNASKVGGCEWYPLLGE